MSVEGLSPSQDLQETTPQPTEYCIFLAGGGGTNKGIRGIDAALKNHFGTDNVSSFNSLLMGDRPDPKKFQNIGELIQEKIGSGMKVNVIANSLGGAEFYEVLKSIEEDNPTFFSDQENENAKKIEATLISPVGFHKGLRGAWTFLNRFRKFVRQEAGIPVVSNPANEREGIVSLSTVSPKAIESEDLVSGLRDALPDLTQYKEGYKEVVPEFSNRSVVEKMKDADKEALEIIDVTLQSALDNRNQRGIREMLKKRGELLAPYTMNAFAGEYTEGEEDPLPDEFRWTIGARIGLGRMLINMFKGKPMEEMKKMQDKGMSVQYVIPEFDVLMPLRDIEAFFENEEEARDNSVVLSGQTHNTFAIAPGVLGPVLQRLKDSQTVDGII